VPVSAQTINRRSVQPLQYYPEVMECPATEGIWSNK
jgi:hypothetical protein